MSLDSDLPGLVALVGSHQYLLSDFLADYWADEGISMAVSLAKFPFTDLHGFKDYVIYVQTYLPDRFPPRQAVGPEDQWTLELAFRGLREGLALAVAEKGDKPVFKECGRLVEEAHEQYRTGHQREGFFKLEEVNKLLKMVPSQ